MFLLFLMFCYCSYSIYLSTQYLRGFWPFVLGFGIYPPKIMKGEFFEEAEIILAFLMASLIV
jgi:hypothetical protein